MINMFGGVLSHDLLSTVAGRPLRTPVSLLQSSEPAQNVDKHLLFIVEQGARHPFALVKWARGAAIQGLEREQSALTSLRARGDALLTSSCPPCWGPFEVGGDAAILVQRCLPGRPAYAKLRSSLWPRQFVPGHFAATATWLAHFSAATRSTSRPFDEGMVDQYIAQPLRDAEARFGNLVVPDGALESVCDAAHKHIGQPVSLVAEHGDLWVANLLFNRSGMYVIDWEHFVPESLPGFDMLFFCISYAIHFPWRPFGWERDDIAFSRALLERTWFTEHIASFLDRVCASTGLPSALVPVMLPVVLARMALRLFRLSSDGTLSESSWLRMLRSWWTRPEDNWLDNWAGKVQPK